MGERTFCGIRRVYIFIFAIRVMERDVISELFSLKGASQVHVFWSSQLNLLPTLLQVMVSSNIDNVYILHDKKTFELLANQSFATI